VAEDCSSAGVEQSRPQLSLEWDCAMAECVDVRMDSVQPARPQPTGDGGAGDALGLQLSATDNAVLPLREAAEPFCGRFRPDLSRNLPRFDHVGDRRC